MKRFDTPTIRIALIAYVVAVTLIGVYSAGWPYLSSYMVRFFEADAVGQVHQGSQLADHIRNSQTWGASSSDIAVCNLPDGWQINRRGGKLWLTHYNPNGSVADCLPFDSVENFYQWFETHPDCCDVDIEKVAVDELKDAENVTTDMPDTTSSAGVTLTQ